MAKKRKMAQKAWIGWGLAGLWMAFAIWFQFLRPEPPQVYTGIAQSFDYDDPCRMSSGYSKPSFSQRYACTSKRRFEEDVEMFLSGTAKLLVVLGPPLLVLVYLRRRNPRGGAGAVRKSAS